MLIGYLGYFAEITSIDTGMSTQVWGGWGALQASFFAWLPNTLCRYRYRETLPPALVQPYVTDVVRSVLLGWARHPPPNNLQSRIAV